MGGGRKKKNRQVNKLSRRYTITNKNPAGAAAATASTPSASSGPEQKKDPLSFYERFLELKSGVQLDSWLLQIRVQEVFRMKEGIFYARNHSVEESASLRNLSFLEMAQSLIDHDGFRFENEKDIPGIFFGRLESLDLDPHRTGKGMVLPYILQEGDLHLDNVLERDRIDLRKAWDDAEAMSYFSFPGSLISSHIVPGAGTRAVTLLMLGVPQTWVSVAAELSDKVKEALLKELKELGLDDKDPLLDEENGSILKKDCVNLVLAPSFYKRHDIPYGVTDQDVGELTVFERNSIRYGISHGVNLARAVVSKSSRGKILAAASGRDGDSVKNPKGSQENKDPKMKAKEDGKPTSSSTVTSSALDTDRVPESAGKDATELTSGLNDLLNLK